MSEPKAEKQLIKKTVRYANTPKQRIFIMPEVAGMTNPKPFGILIGLDGKRECMSLADYAKRFEDGDFITTLPMSLNPQFIAEIRAASKDTNPPKVKRTIGKLERDPDTHDLQIVVTDYEYE